MVLLFKFDLLMVSFYWLAEFKNLRTSESVSVLLRIAACSEHMRWVITLYVHFSSAKGGASFNHIINIYKSVLFFVHSVLRNWRIICKK